MRVLGQKTTGGGANAPPSLFRVKYVTFNKTIQL